MKKMQRSAGILMPIFSLPSPYGIGTFGKAAYDFADFLKDAGQHYWQMLPLGPTGYGDSPYQSFSTFAGNPYFIDLDTLKKEGLLTQEEIDLHSPVADEQHVDYGALYSERYQLLRMAYRRGWAKEEEALARFINDNNSWLSAYAEYMAIKEHFDNAPWNTWPDEGAVRRDPESLKYYRGLLQDDIRFHIYMQYQFFKQWKALKAYVNRLGIEIIGDVPIYVSMDSADVWSDPSQFRMDDQYMPTEVAGVPPDYFSENGQLWGNPLYNYERMAWDGYGWWIRRIDGASKLFDVIRIDHFRGFESYWAVPYGSPTAKIGRWLPGPGMGLVGTLVNWFPQLSFIAEDLGIVTEEVDALLKESGLPGMKVLEFACTKGNKYLPHNMNRDCVCYTGTHDNSPLLLWKEEADPEELKFAEKYFGINDKEGFCRGFIRAGITSPANLFVAQMQDYLELGKGCRINTPGVADGNWTWRCLPGALTDKLAMDIRDLTDLGGRLLPAVVTEPEEAEEAK